MKKEYMLTKLSEFLTVFPEAKLLRKYEPLGSYIFITRSPINNKRHLVYRFLTDRYSNIEGDLLGSVQDWDLSCIGADFDKDRRCYISYDELLWQVETKYAVVHNTEGEEIDINDLQKYDHFLVNGEECHFEDKNIVTDDPQVYHKLTPELKKKFNIKNYDNNRED